MGNHKMSIFQILFLFLLSLIHFSNSSSTCPPQSSPVQHPDLLIYSDGCGDYSPQQEDGYNMTDCCVYHDICYGICNADMDLCNDEYEKCLYHVCREVYKVDARTCSTQVSSYLGGAQIFGKMFFKENQEKHCICVKDEMVQEHYEGYVKKVLEKYGGKMDEEKKQKLVDSELRQHKNEEWKVVYKMHERYPGLMDLHINEVRLRKEKKMEL